LRTHGSSPENKYKNLEIGVNSRLDAIQAAILSVKIKYLDQGNDRRAEIANRYDEGLSGIADIITPFAAPDNRHVYHQYTMRTAKRDQLAQFLKNAQIPAMIYFLSRCIWSPRLNIWVAKPAISRPVSRRPEKF